jgi:hypothetical protein
MPQQAGTGGRQRGWPGQGVEPGTAVAVAFVEDRWDELHRCVVVRLALDAALREKPHDTSRSARLAWANRLHRPSDVGNRPDDAARREILNGYEVRVVLHPKGAAERYSITGVSLFEEAL